MNYILSVDITVMPIATACCFPSAIIAYQMKLSINYDALKLIRIINPINYHNSPFWAVGHLCSWGSQTWTHDVSSTQNKSDGTLVNLLPW